MAETSANNFLENEEELEEKKKNEKLLMPSQLTDEDAFGW